MADIDKDLEEYLADRDLNLGPEQRKILYNYITKRELALISHIEANAIDLPPNDGFYVSVYVLDNIAKEIRGDA